MRKYAVITVLLALCGVAGAAEWENITPGADLAGWKAEGGEWTVQDGVLSGKAAKDANCWLIYQAREFADVEIEVEFRTPVPTNGGVQFRSQWLPRVPLKEGETVDTAPKQMYGYQANVETRQRPATGRLVDENGRGPLVQDAAEAAFLTLKQKDWNKMRVVAKGNSIEIYLHDVLAAKFEDEAYIRGYIALQSFAFDQQDATVMEYRNIRVKDEGRNGEWRALFNGADFAGWKQWGEEDWSVKDGVIDGHSGPKKSEGYLATEETFKDFRVRGAFKMLGAGNFGLFYHSTITLRDKDGYPVISGLQGEVAPDYPSPTGWVYESYKRGWLTKPDPNAPAAMALRRDQWNEIEIRSIGNHVTTWVNGMRTLDLVDEKQLLHEGSFALQLHAGGVDGILWKDLYVLK